MGDGREREATRSKVRTRDTHPVPALRGQPMKPAPKFDFSKVTVQATGADNPLVDPNYIDNLDEYVRNTTARAFAVVASALGIPSLLPFLKAVCLSKKSWQARHTGIKIVQQIAILMGCAVLPHLRQMVEIVEHGLDEGGPLFQTSSARKR